MTQFTEAVTKLNKKDFQSEQNVRWCPGCGDYVVLATLQQVLTQLDIPKEQYVFVSGIGCSSRLPYYMNTYGFHTIHGRAPAVATGVRLANPKLSVWVITGDGDCLAIGGNHFIHVVRRNVNVKIIILNNRIFALTKGQCSPTSPLNLKTYTSPEGVMERPFNIGELAIGAQATFFARVPDNDKKLMEEVMIKAAKHKGTAIIEVLQNCVIFNDGIHEAITGKENRENNQLILKQDQLMLFGKEKQYGVQWNGFALEKVHANKNEIPNGLMVKQDQNKFNKILIHDANNDNSVIHSALVKMQLPDMPVAMGIIREVNAPVFEDEIYKITNNASQKRILKNVSELINSGNTWEVN